MKQFSFSSGLVFNLGFSNSLESFSVYLFLFISLSEWIAFVKKKKKYSKNALTENTTSIKITQNIGDQNICTLGKTHADVVIL